MIFSDTIQKKEGNLQPAQINSTTVKGGIAMKTKWKKIWEEAIKEEIEYILSRLEWKLQFAKVGKDEEVLRMRVDWRFFRKDILDRLSNHPILHSLNCYVEPLYEYEIVFKKK